MDNSSQSNADEKPIHIEAHLPDKVGLAGHNWVQRGPVLTCRSCPYEHSQFIDPRMIYKGLDPEGIPILELVK